MRAVSLIIFLAVGFSSAQQIGLGGCPDVKVTANFDAKKYLGTWYENRKFSTIFELGGKCVKAEYYPSSEDGVINVRNTQINSLTSLVSSVDGSAKLDSDNGEAKLTVTLSIAGLFNTSAPYWVLETDYDNYASVWSCSDAVNLVNGQSAWILTRSRTPSPDIIVKALEIYEYYGIDITKFRVTDQSGCSN